MKRLCTLLIPTALMMFISGCSSTVLNESWRSPEYSGKLNSLYVVGVSKNETTRRMFEDAFNSSLKEIGVNGLPSYGDFPTGQKADKDQLLSKVRERGADAIMVTRMVKKEKETVVNSGLTTAYSTGGYYPSAYHRRYDSYYLQRYDAIYQPPMVSTFEIATIESNIYDSTTGDLIWGSRLEVTVGGPTEDMIADFVKEVIKDLKSKELI